ncbi:MAG: hypothetical protein AAFV53_38255, partial [Myxococcota bacterium]
TVATALGVARALELGPAGLVAAPLIGAAGALQVGAILAQPPPQISQKHIGEGMIGARDPLMPDERMVGNTRMLTGEMSTSGGVLNRGAAQTVNDMNAGRIPGGGSKTVVAPWKHLDAELDRSARSGRSRFSRSIRSRKRNRDPNRGW